MKAIMNVYESNKDFVENFIYITIGRLNIEKLDDENATRLFKSITYAKLAYYVNEDFILSSPYYYKDRTDKSKTGLNKKYYFTKVDFSQNGEYLSKPYISSNTGKISVTYAKKLEEGYLIIDLDIISVLESLKLIRSNKFARAINSFVYGFMGFSLLFFSIFLGIYAIVTFIISLLSMDYFNLENTFKSIIALTLGLAIFDLAKTILEQEIFYKNISTEEGEENKILSKFLVSIIIALSIESLMVVFKIALNDYTDMIHGFLLIVGVSLMIYTVGKYNQFTNKDS